MARTTTTAKKTTAKKTTAKKTTAKKTTAKKTTAKKTTAKKTAAKKTAAKKTAAKKTAAKVSPNRGMPIDAWLAANTSGWQQQAARTILDLVADVVPGSTVSIKWNQPVFEQQGPFAFIRPAKAHVSIGFWQGHEVDDPSGKLEPGGTRGHYKIRSLAQLDVKNLAAMLKAAAKINAGKKSK